MDDLVGLRSRLTVDAVLWSFRVLMDLHSIVLRSLGDILNDKARRRSRPDLTQAV